MEGMIEEEKDHYYWSGHNSRLFHSNQIIIFEDYRRNIPEYVLTIPAYLQIKVNNFADLSVENLSMLVNCTLVLTVYYGDLNEDLVEYLSKNIILDFKYDDAIRLKPDQEEQFIIFYENKYNKTFTYVIKKKFTTFIEPYIFFTPLQILDCILSINAKINYCYKTDPRIKFKINFMNNNENEFDQKFFVSSDGTIGHYDLAEKRRHAEYSNMQKPISLREVGKNIYSCKCNCEVEELFFHEDIQVFREKEIRQFQYAHFHIPLYKFPSATLGTIFLPMSLLAVISVFTFFFKYDLQARLTIVATLMISYVALIPVIRSQIPPNSMITFIEIFVYAEVFTSFFCLMDIFVKKSESQKNPLIDFNAFSDSLFLVCFFITLIATIMPIIMYIVHRFYLMNKHNEYFLYTKLLEDSSKLNITDWNQNQTCNEYFADFRQLVEFSPAFKKVDMSFEKQKNQDSREKYFRMKNIVEKTLSKS